MNTKSTKKLLSVAAGLAILANAVAVPPAGAVGSGSSIELPAAPGWGHFVDNYKNNTSVNLAVYANPAIGILSGFLELWTPGTSWDNGTKLNSAILDANIQYVADIAATRTKAEEDMAYYDDRRNQTYGAIDGLGSLSGVYRQITGTYTTITDIPADATTVKYTDGNGTNKGGNSDSELGAMVDLIGTIRGNYASTNPAKAFYSYMRPFRWKDTSVIVPTLVPAKSSTPATDGGFPSGHTNASYLAALSLAYAVPERFQELLTRASEMGNNRIVAGMHSPFDVMGGRMMATALAAATLADPDNAALKQEAYDQAHEVLLKQTGTAEDRFSDYAKNKAQFTQRLTYNFPQINSVTQPMVVPKGAEVLLETRLPYLSAEQRRAVLATTGIASGYPLLDDPEGWGRLNLFAAADGYGALTSDVTVTMDAAKGGFHAADRWRNDISGSGELTKEGTGTLTLTGSNTYSGGTEINAGTLEGDSATAFGSGDVVNNRGSVVENVYGKLTVGGDFEQAAEGSLELNLTGEGDVLEVKGAVKAGGKLEVNIVNNYVPAEGVLTLITHGDGQRSGQFGSVEVNGLPSTHTAHIDYQNNRIALVIDDTTNNGSSNSGGSNSGGSNSGGTTGGTATPTPTPTPSATPAPTGQPGTATPAPEVNPFQAGVVSRDDVLKSVNDAIAATQNQSKTFSDTAGHWGSSTIGAAVKLQIVDGYADGSFRPNATVTRAEFAAMIARAFGLAERTAAGGFSDTGSNWAAGYIDALSEKGVITGYADGSFKPAAAITRAEMVTIIGRVLNLAALQNGSAAGFTDVSGDYWAAAAIQQASAANLIQGVSASAFAPKNNATRAEAVALIIRALQSDSSVKALIDGL
ncbi:S-layer homology domain-containing protein [Paenibacillus tepidiphilus]|uniref:S-layer homology domain-containing protein n=1 Tax=Paenibacillus tepidiphilus TaxID=2608683 RepID=UPI001EF0083E|nr:S-layer homology domain-containing protein [Paenibacillus tepidiphilus]